MVSGKTPYTNPRGFRRIATGLLPCPSNETNPLYQNFIPLVERSYNVIPEGRGWIPT